MLTLTFNLTLCLQTQHARGAELQEVGFILNFFLMA